MATIEGKGSEMFASIGKRRLVACLLLTAATLALYSGVARNGFVSYDDERYVLNNPHVRAGIRWSTVDWAFRSRAQANWHPLTWLSHALDCQLFGLNPAGHHYVSLMLHALNVALVFLVLSWITGSTGRSFLVALLFAVHPINVESVAWVAERKTVLAMTFFLLSLGAYAWYARQPARGRYLLVMLLFAAGLMSKPMVITLPFVLLLLDYWPLGRTRLGPEKQPLSSVGSNTDTRSWLWLCLEKVPLLILSLLSAAITVAVQTQAGAVQASTPLVARVENAIVSYVLYVGKAFWPSPLAALYPYSRVGQPLWRVVVCSLLLVLVTVAVVRHRQHRYLAWGWFWYLGTMLPMIGLVQVGNQAMADRYAYLPFIGLFGMAVWALAEGIGRERRQWSMLLSLLFILGFAAVTRRQVQYWHDDFSLWSHALAVTQNNFVAEDNFGLALIERGRYDEGIAHFRSAAKIEPGDPTSQINLGIDAEKRGDLRKAIEFYKMGLRLSGDPVLRASAYANLGGIYYTLGDTAQARENFESAVSLKAGFPFVFLDLGLITQRAGEWNKAADCYNTYVALEPNDVGYLLLGQALDHIGQAQAAQLAYQQAGRSSSDLERAHESVRKLLGE